MISKILGQKQCARCRKTKILADFYKNAGGRGSQGVQNYCKACCKEIREESINIECEFKISKLCKVQYCIRKQEYNKNIKRNKGKYRCLYCGAEATHLNNFKKYKIHNVNFFKNIDSELKLIC